MSKPNIKETGKTATIWWVEAQNEATRQSLGVRFNARPQYKAVQSAEKRKNLFQTTYDEVVKLKKSSFHNCSFYKQEGEGGEIVPAEA